MNENRCRLPETYNSQSPNMSCLMAFCRSGLSTFYAWSFMPVDNTAKLLKLKVSFASALLSEYGLVLLISKWSKQIRLSFTIDFTLVKWGECFGGFLVEGQNEKDPYVIMSFQVGKEFTQVFRNEPSNSSMCIHFLEICQSP